MTKVTKRISPLRNRGTRAARQGYPLTRSAYDRQKAVKALHFVSWRELKQGRTMPLYLLGSISGKRGLRLPRPAVLPMLAAAAVLVLLLAARPGETVEEKVSSLGAHVSAPVRTVKADSRKHESVPAPEKAEKAKAEKKAQEKNVTPAEKNADLLKRRDMRISQLTLSMNITDQFRYDLYEAADSDRNEQLSWKELEMFCARLETSGMRAKAAESMVEWQETVCGLLSYWGLQAYIGGFRDAENNRAGYTVVFIRSDKSPKRYRSFQCSTSVAAALSILPGSYVPVERSGIGNLRNLEKKNGLLWVRKVKSFFGEA